MKIALLSGLYNRDPKHRERLSSLLEALTEGLDLRIRRIELSPGLIHLDYEGEDSEVYRSLLKERFGEAYLKRESLRRMDEAQGVIVGHSKHGLIVDLGVRRPRTEYATIPRKVLDAQLADGVNLTVRELVDKFCLIPFLALKVDILRVRPRIAVELSSGQVEYYWEWEKMGFPRVVISGPSRTELEEALKDPNLKDRIVELESSTFTTHILALKLCEDGAETVETLKTYLNTAKILVYKPNLERFRYKDKMLP